MDLGPRLRASREQSGLTLEEVAARTKIPRQLLADLEKDDVSRWPKSRIYQVGFLRAYASTVGLDANQVIAQFASVQEQPRQGTSPARRRPSAEADAEPRRLMVGAATVVGCLFVTLLIYAPRLDSGSETETVAKPVAPIQASPRVPADAQPTSDSAAPATFAVPDAPEQSQQPDTAIDIDGELLIDSDPPGTRVVVNGIGRGPTPVRIRFLPAGSYSIRLVREGYQAREAAVTLTAEHPVRSIKLTLREVSAGPD